MRITESKLKNIIRQVIKESEYESVQALADRHPELHDVEPTAPLSPEERLRGRELEALDLADRLFLRAGPNAPVDQERLRRAISRLSLLLQK